MVKKKFKRLNLIIIFIISGGVSLFFLLKALEEEIVFFYTPSETLEKELLTNDTIRVGGIVLEKSINYKNDLQISFIITDKKNDLEVLYFGILPDLFREGQGVIVEGNMDKKNNIFNATRVLAKHDENYMPPEVIKSLKEEK